MARSDSRNYTLTRNDLIKRAFQYAGIYDIRSSIPDDEMNLAVDLLNMMIKHWQAEDVFLWNRREATLFTAKDTNKYSLGGTGDHATTSYVSTQVATAASSGASTLVMDSTTGMTANDNIGIELDDGTRQWTTITSVDSSTNVTLDGTLDDDVNVDAYVVSYTNKINRPLLILNGRWSQLDNTATEVVANMMRRNDYFNISNKTAAGAPNQFYYDKQLDNGTLYLFQRPDDVDYIFNFSYYDEVEDMDSATDNFDFPLEFTYAITWNLSAEIALAYGMHPEHEKLQQKADRTRLQLRGFNYDGESILMAPARER